MSLYGTMRTGVSGMNAQANRLGTVADNIANASTTGYKRASTEFSSMILASSGGEYNSGGVNSNVRYSITTEGAHTYTSSRSDLAIKGNGFFIVNDANGSDYLTRAGAFQQNAVGELVNSAGFKLMGYKFDEAGTDPTVVVNSFEGLVPINVSEGSTSAQPTTSGLISSKFPSTVATGTKQATSISVFDSQGNPRMLLFNYEKTADNTWSLKVTEKGVPDATEKAQTFELKFDATGKLTAPADGLIKVARLDGFRGANRSEITFNISGMNQNGDKFDAGSFDVNGSKPSDPNGFVIGPDGVVSVQSKDGTLKKVYRIPLADVQSPDKLQPLSGNVYQQGIDSGIIVSSFAQTASFGSIVSGALESSNVDMAAELTMMIESQRSYTANSKVFQTGADLMDVLVNLKR